MNIWTFSGRVGADAELRTTQNNEKVLNFRVANDIGFGDRRTTQWVDCSYWGKRAEAVSSYVRKGDKITVSGEVKLEDFNRRDGTPGSKLAVRVNDLDLASRADGGGNQQQDQGTGGYGAKPIPTDHERPPAGSGARGGGKPAFDQDLDDEIPF